MKLLFCGHISSSRGKKIAFEKYSARKTTQTKKDVPYKSTPFLLTRRLRKYSQIFIQGKCLWRPSIQESQSPTLQVPKIKKTSRTSPTKRICVNPRDLREIRLFLLFFQSVYVRKIQATHFVYFQKFYRNYLTFF